MSFFYELKRFVPVFLVAYEEVRVHMFVVVNVEVVHEVMVGNDEVCLCQHGGK